MKKENIIFVHRHWVGLPWTKEENKVAKLLFVNIETQLWVWYDAVQNRSCWLMLTIPTGSNRRCCWVEQFQWARRRSCTILLKPENLANKSFQLIVARRRIVSWREIVTPPPLISHSTRYATPQLVRDFHSSSHFRSEHNNILFQVPISLDRGARRPRMILHLQKLSK